MNAAIKCAIRQRTQDFGRLCVVWGSSSRVSFCWTKYRNWSYFESSTCWSRRRRVQYGDFGYLGNFNNGSGEFYGMTINMNGMTIAEFMELPELERNARVTRHNPPITMRTATTMEREE